MKIVGHVLLIVLHGSCIIRNVIALPHIRQQTSLQVGASEKPSSARALSKKGSNSGENHDSTDGGLYCVNSDDGNAMLAELFVAPRSRVDEFLNAYGRAIVELRPFVKKVRKAIDDDELSSNITDREILIAAMAPPLPLLVIEGTAEEQGREDCIVAVRCAAIFTTLLLASFDFSFSLVGLSGPLGAVSNIIGRRLAAKIVASPRGAQIISQIVNIAKSSSGNVVEAVSKTVALVFNEVGVSGILNELKDAPELNFWNYLGIASSFVADIAAIGLSGGAVIALKIAKAGVSTVNLFNAINDFQRCFEECTPQPTPTPTPMPTPSPTPMPTRPPTPQPTPPPTSPPGLLSGVFGDPHLSTFDRLRFDCQAAGEFTTVTSLENPSDFIIQERFTSVRSDLCTQASVSTGIAIRDDNVPTLQISTPRGDTINAMNTVADCPIDFYVDGTARTITEDPASDGSVEVTISGSRIRMTYPSSNVFIDASVRSSGSFGCFFLVQVFIPDNYRSGETILGLLGTPNGNRADDWIQPDGTSLDIPTSDEDSIFEPSYQYCVDNWCVRDEVNSIFTYGPGEYFDDIFGCDETYQADVEDAVTNPSPAVAAICGENVFCLVDGFCGGVVDATLALADEQTVAEEQEAANPSPSSSPSFSSMPSLVPSSQPSESAQPSSSPSFSSMPSLVPSSQPSVSAQPSVKTSKSTKGMAGRRK